MHAVLQAWQHLCCHAYIHEWWVAMPPKFQMLLCDVAKYLLGTQVGRYRDVHVDFCQGLVPLVYCAPLVLEDMLCAGS